MDHPGKYKYLTDSIIGKGSQHVIDTEIECSKDLLSIHQTLIKDSLVKFDCDEVETQKSDDAMKIITQK